MALFRPTCVWSHPNSSDGKPYMKSCIIAALLLLAACDGVERPRQEGASEQEVLPPADEGNEAERLEAAERRGEALARETIARDAKATAASNNSVIPPMD